MMAGAAGGSTQAGGAAGNGRSNWRDGGAQQQRQPPASASAAGNAKRGGGAGVDAAGRPLRRSESEASSSLSAPAGRSSHLGTSGASFVPPARGATGTEKASGVAALMDNISEDDYGATLKLKAAQALFRLSSEPGAEPTLLQEGIVEALSKLLDMPSTAVGRLVAGALANLTCTPEAAELLLQKHGHRVLSALVGTTANTTSSSSGSSSSSSSGARDDPTLAACALALCRCSSTAQGAAALVSEHNAAQSLCAIAQRQSTALRLRAARGIMNLCGLQGGGAPGFATVKHEVFLVALCGTVEELAKVELEPVQGFVCDVVGRLCGKCTVVLLAALVQLVYCLLKIALHIHQSFIS
jgi:hypothetical protein